MDKFRWAGAVVAVDPSTPPCRRNDDTDGRILGANGVEDMGAITSSIADAPSGRIGHLLRQWPEDERRHGLPCRSDRKRRFRQVGGDAGMKLGTERAKISRFSRPFGVLSKHREKGNKA
jgi:hypothetical protein